MTKSQPAVRPPILLLGPGRCGSSLLQRVLNTSPRISMWGEHGGFLIPLARTWKMLVENEALEMMHYGEATDLEPLVRGVLPPGAPSVNWANPFDREAVRAALRGFIESLLAPGIDRREVHFGFKEIRYGRDSGVIELWQTLFPFTRFVFVVRHPRETVRSMYLAWREHFEADREAAETIDRLKTGARLWADQVHAIADWHADQGIPSHLLRFEDLEKRPAATIETTFGFLGLPVPEEAMGHLEDRHAFTRDHPDRARIDAAIADGWDEIAAITDEAARRVGYDTTRA